MKRVRNIAAVAAVVIIVLSASLVAAESDSYQGIALAMPQAI